MQYITTILLFLHILGGASALISGAIVLAIKKGNTTHRRMGNLFRFSMLTNGVSALILSVIHPNYMLFIIGIFSLYLSESGKRMAATGDVYKTMTTKAISTLMLITALLFIIDGGYKMINGNQFGVVLSVFGCIAVFLVRQDFKFFAAVSTSYNQRLRSHIGKMIGSYISASTAFLVVNNTILPGLVAWLLPTLLLVPMIIFWSRKYG